MKPLDQIKNAVQYLEYRGAKGGVSILSRKSGIALASLDDFAEFRQMFAGTKAKRQHVAGGCQYTASSEDGEIEFTSINYGELGNTDQPSTVVTL